MIKKIKSKPFNHFIRTLLLDERFFKLNPIIAGGFPVAIYGEIMDLDGPKDWSSLVDRLDRENFQALSTEFGDIDVYFTRDNPIWTSENHWLVSERQHDELETILENEFNFRLPVPVYYRRWANTYLKDHYGRPLPYQFIKISQASVEECLNGFDLIASCIAWHYDVLYIHESFEDLFLSQVVEFNQSGMARRGKEDVYARMFTGRRAYKYASRLGFRLSDEVQEFCDQLYLESKSIDLNSDAPLLDFFGNSTNNPRPNSSVFQGVARHFWIQHEAYQKKHGITKLTASSDQVDPPDHRKKLTIGMATYDDYDGVYFSIQAIRLFHPEVTEETEILVVDNNPKGPCATALRALKKWVKNYRYIANDTITGTAVRDVIFREADAAYVLCIDSHVMIEAGRIRQLIEFFDTRAQTGDLLQGPLLMDDMKSLYSHFEPVWRDGMYGIWGTDNRALDPGEPEFPIQMQGLGLFACRRSDWPGFNPGFCGFGGEEGYIHQKFRNLGGRTLCLPFLRWLHRFERPMGTRYQNNMEHRIRNYLIGFDELGMDKSELEAHYCGLVGEAIVTKVKTIVRQEKNNPFDYFDAIYCINREDQSERWRTMQEQFEQLGIVYRVRRFLPLERNDCTDSRYTLSHRAIVSEAKQQGFKNVLVFEDETLFFQDALELLKSTLVELEDNRWNIAYLGDAQDEVGQHEKLNGCRHLQRAVGVSDCFAVAYHHSYYDKLLVDVPEDDTLRLWLKMHGTLGNYLQWNEAPVIFSPAIATQGQSVRID